MSFVDSLSKLLPGRWGGDLPLVPVVRLTGAIGISVPLRPSLRLQACGPALERAFSTRGARAVALVINSPGGSPVQSHLIYRRIRSLAEEKKIPVLAFVEDAAASGGYMIACAADEIFADPSSIVGSIGVISAGFGFDRLIERFGVERRVHATGENKGLLDPFRPQREEDVVRLKEIQRRIYEMFVDLVRTRRAGRLPEAERDDLFSGAFWAGRDAHALGLVDGIGDMRFVLRQRFGEKVRLRLYEAQRPGLAGRFLRRLPSIEGGLLDPGALLAAAEERALWSRLGL